MEIEAHTCLHFLCSGSFNRQSGWTQEDDPRAASMRPAQEILIEDFRQFQFPQQPPACGASLSDDEILGLGLVNKLSHYQLLFFYSIPRGLGRERPACARIPGKCASSVWEVPGIFPWEEKKGRKTDRQTDRQFLTAPPWCFVGVDVLPHAFRLSLGKGL